MCDLRAGKIRHLREAVADRDGTIVGLRDHVRSLLMQIAEMKADMQRGICATGAGGTGRAVRGQGWESGGG